MFIQYRRQTKTPTDGLINVGLNQSGLITCGQKTTTGTPDSVANKYVGGCIIINSANSLVYYNAGTTTSPSWQILGQGGGGNTIITTVTLTPSQILNIGTNPVTIIPAPAPGSYIFLRSMLSKLEFNTTPYENLIDPGDAGIIGRIGNTSGFNVPISLQSPFVSSSQSITIQSSVPSGSYGEIKDGSPLFLTTQAGNNLSNGDSPITIRLEYEIVTF